MSRMGMVLKLGGNYLDHAGKVMALKAFGEHNDDVTSVDHIDDLKDMWDFEVIESHLSDQQYMS